MSAASNAMIEAFFEGFESEIPSRLSKTRARLDLRYRLLAEEDVEGFVVQCGIHSFAIRAADGDPLPACREFGQKLGASWLNAFNEYNEPPKPAAPEEVPS